MCSTKFEIAAKRFQPMGERRPHDTNQRLDSSGDMRHEFARYIESIRCDVSRKNKNPTPSSIETSAKFRMEATHVMRYLVQWSEMMIFL